MIGHHERMHKQGFYEMTPEGGKFAGKINPESDLAYQTLLVALKCVERALTAKKIVRYLAFFFVGHLLARLTSFLIRLF